MKSTGRATSFVTAEDPQQLNAIERLLGHAVPWAADSPQPSSYQREPTRTHPRKGRSSFARTTQSRLHGQGTRLMPAHRQSPESVLVP
jgi:ATP-dependent RNA helicase RhlE